MCVFVCVIVRDCVSFACDCACVVLREFTISKSGSHNRNEVLDYIGNSAVFTLMLDADWSVHDPNVSWKERDHATPSLSLLFSWIIFVRLF